MQLRLIGCALVMIGLLVMARADDEVRPPAPATRPARMPREEGPLHHGMEDMGRAFKKLQAQVADPGKNESSLTLLAQMQSLTVSGKSECPRL